MLCNLGKGTKLSHETSPFSEMDTVQDYEYEQVIFET